MSSLIYLEVSNVTKPAPLQILLILLKMPEERYASCSTGKELAEVDISH